MYSAGLALVITNNEAVLLIDAEADAIENGVDEPEEILRSEKSMESKAEKVVESSRKIFLRARTDESAQSRDEKDASVISLLTYVNFRPFNDTPSRESRAETGASPYT